MPRKPSSAPADFPNLLLEAFAVNEHLNQFVLEHLDARAWEAKPPSRGARPISALFTHMHNVRLKWLRLSAPHIKLPVQIRRSSYTKKQVRSALTESGQLCSEKIRQALAGDGRVRQFRRDGWSRPWLAGASMVIYMISHEAHHRGQICMLAHQLGFQLKVNAMAGMWNWERLWKECGFSGPR
jgi:uncharacterized damage-inducible protein DinB